MREVIAEAMATLVVKEMLGEMKALVAPQPINTPEEPRTLDGTPLSKLGKGLGKGAQGEPCTVCKTKGYFEHKRPRTVLCSTCDGAGKVPRRFPCFSCNQTGKFTQKFTKRVVTCLACKGTGVFTHQVHTTRCGGCRGEKTIAVEGEHNIYYEECLPCSGRGEIPIKFNPVLTLEQFELVLARVRRARAR